MANRHRFKRPRGKYQQTQTVKKTILSRIGSRYRTSGKNKKDRPRGLSEQIRLDKRLSVLCRVKLVPRTSWCRLIYCLRFQVMVLALSLDVAFVLRMKQVIIQYFAFGPLPIQINLAVVLSVREPRRREQHEIFVLNVNGQQAEHPSKPKDLRNMSFISFWCRP